jgi:hypothetical protein
VYSQPVKCFELALITLNFAILILSSILSSCLNILNLEFTVQDVINIRVCFILYFVKLSALHYIHTSARTVTIYIKYKLFSSYILCGASVAKWLSHLPFTSKVAGSNLGENISMSLETSPHVKGVKVNALPKVVGFLRVLLFPPAGKVDRVG